MSISSSNFDYYYISSKDRQSYEIDSNFSFRFKGSNEKAYHVESVIMPFTWYNIRAPFNNFKYTVNNVVYNANLKEGTYNLNQLLTELKTKTDALVAQSGITYTFSSDGITNKVTIAKSGNASLIFDDTTIYRELGFIKQTYASSTTDTGSYLPNLTGGAVIYILSNALTRHNSRIHNTDSILMNIIARIAVDVSFGSIISNIGLINNIRSSDVQLNESVDLRVVDEWLRPLSFNGYDWYLKLKLYKSDDSLVNL